jgi:hypothetical protein
MMANPTADGRKGALFPNDLPGPGELAFGDGGYIAFDINAQRTSRLAGGEFHLPG